MFPTTLHTVIMKAEQHEVARAAEKARHQAEARAARDAQTNAVKVRKPLRARVLGRARIAS